MKQGLGKYYSIVSTFSGCRLLFLRHRYADRGVRTIDIENGALRVAGKEDDIRLPFLRTGEKTRIYLERKGALGLNGWTGRQH